MVIFIGHIIFSVNIVKCKRISKFTKSKNHQLVQEQVENQPKRGPSKPIDTCNLIQLMSNFKKFLHLSISKYTSNDYAIKTNNRKGKNDWPILSQSIEEIT